MPASGVTTVSPARAVRGRLRVPGDKSISHRYALVAALATGPSELAGFAPGADCRSTLACLRQLGVEVADGGGGSLTIHGRGVGGLQASVRDLDAGNSGTTVRLLAGIAAGHPFTTRFVGDASLSKRPMRRVIEPLEGMGARLEAADGCLPLTVHGARLRAIAYRTPVPSAQVKSAVLLAGLHAEGVTSVTEAAATRDHTERALRAFGGEVLADGLTASVAGGQRLAGQHLDVPGDFSSAAFWLVAAAAIPGSRVEIDGVGLNPTRTALLDVLRRVGARVHVHPTTEGDEAAGGEPRGTVVVEHGRVEAIEIRPEEVAALIDELPAIGALGALGAGVSVSGAGELRVKESDRIAALVAGLRALGVEADERPDGFLVHGAADRRRAASVADARGDHRMAMAFAIAALGGDAPSTIDGADAVGISYPQFFETLDRLTI
jgi:3-phosphoshikimate 1-carboxyvinyltransferase